MAFCPDSLMAMQDHGTGAPSVADILRAQSAVGGPCQPEWPAWDPSLPMSGAYGMYEELLEYCPFTQDLMDYSEQVTPMFLPGRQDHYTGATNSSLISEPGADKASPLFVHSMPSGVDIHGGWSLLEPSSRKKPALEASPLFVPTDASRYSSTPAFTPLPPKEEPASSCDEAAEARASSGAAPPAPVTKLQRLLYLQLHCMAEGSSDVAALNTADCAAAAPRPSSAASTIPPGSPEAVTDAVARATAEALPPAETSLAGSDDVAAGDEEDAAEAAVSFSAGSVGHPHGCGDACKYLRKKRGCRDGLACSHCHICVWRPQRSRRSGGSSKAAGALAAAGMA